VILQNVKDNGTWHFRM